MSYGIPDITDDYNNEDLTKEILEFANNKSQNMRKSKKFKKSKISVAIEYQYGKYISTSFVNAGDDIEFNDYEDYEDQEINDFGNIISFTVQLIN
jgi:hypothetical protein